MKKTNEHHHIIISGVGRSGTTFLMQLFTQLKMDTGFSDIYESINPNCNAGMEGFNIYDETSPYITKSPFFCDCLEEIIEERDIIIDHILIPIRDLYSAAQSRIFLGDGAEGGLFGTRDPEQQEGILGRKLYNLIHIIVKYDIPTTFLLFPRIVTDPRYLFKKLKFMLKDISYKKFLRAFYIVSTPEKVDYY